MSKPIIICCGFFESRHKTLVSKLGQSYDVRLFLCDGAWAGYEKLSINHIAIEQARLDLASNNYEEFITDIEKRFQLRENPKTKEVVIRYLTQLYKEAEVVQENARVFHSKRNMKAILAVNDQLGPIRAMVNFGKQNKIPTIYIEHGFSFTSFGTSALRIKDKPELPVTDIICVDNELQKKEYLDFYKQKESKPEIYVTGNPLDGIKNVENNINKPNKSPISPSIILFCPSWFEANSLREVLLGNDVEDEAFHQFCLMMKGLISNSPNQKFQAVVKLHPTMTKLLGVDTTSYYERVADEYNILPNLRVDDGPVRNWLDKADLMVTSKNSSVIWEAFLCQVPCITYLSQFYKNILRQEKWQQPTYLSRWGVQLYLDDKADWVLSAEKLILSHRNGEFGKLCTEHQKKLDVVDTLEASENVVQLIHEKAIHKKQDEVILIQDEKNSKENKLRVLQIVHDFPPQSYSGTELYTFNFSQELKKRGHDVTVLYPVHDSGKKSLQFEAAEFDGLKVVQFNVFQPQKKNSDVLNKEFDLPFKDFLANHEFDIVHIQHLFGMSANWVNIAKEAGLPVMMKLDDMYLYCRQGHLMYKGESCCTGPDSIDKCYECTFQPKADSDPEMVASSFYYMSYRRIMLQRMFQNVDFVHTPSQFLKDSCIANNLNNTEFHVIPTGISPFEIQKKSRKDKALRIGFMGEIEIRKGIEIYLDAIVRANKKIAPNKQAAIQFKIYGRNFGNERFQSILEKVNKIQNVMYFGSFSPEDRNRVFSEIDLLVMPSLGENYPFILREALYAGIPAVATDIAGVPEVIRNKKDGILIPPGDVKALAEVFIKIAHSPDLLKKMTPQKNKIKLIADDARAMEEIYIKLIQDKSGNTQLRGHDFQTIHDLISNEKYVEGLNLLAKIIDEEPQNPEALNLMAEIYGRLGKIDEALKLKQMAERLSD